MYKNPPHMGPEILYTTGAGRGVKVSVAIFPFNGGGVSNSVSEIHFLYRHIRNYYLSNSKTFQDGNGNGNFGKINSNDFQDGNWESMEMKG